MNHKQQVRAFKAKMRRILQDGIAEYRPFAQELGMVIELRPANKPGRSSQTKVILWRKVRRHDPQLIANVVKAHKENHGKEDIAEAYDLSVKQVDNILYRYHRKRQLAPKPRKIGEVDLKAVKFPMIRLVRHPRLSWPWLGDKPIGYIDPIGNPNALTFFNAIAFRNTPSLQCPLNHLDPR